MRKRFYVDTAIWRDFLENRTDGLRPLGEFAFLFLKDCERHKCKILYSEIILLELKVFPEEKIEKMFSLFQTVLKKVEYTEKQSKEANKIFKRKNVAFNDILHAIIARDNKAIIVSRDKHFEELEDIVDCVRPEEVNLA